MITKTIRQDKNIKLSDKVQSILFKKGYSFLFNWEDYRFYKRQSKNAIFPAHAIAEKFIENSSQTSDYSEYQF